MERFEISEATFLRLLNQRLASDPFCAGVRVSKWQEVGEIVFRVDGGREPSTGESYLIMRRVIEAGLFLLGKFRIQTRVRSQPEHLAGARQLQIFIASLKT